MICTYIVYHGLLVVLACVYVCDFFHTQTFLQIIQIKDSSYKVSVMFLICSKIFSVWLSLIYQGTTASLHEAGVFPVAKMYLTISCFMPHVRKGNCLLTLNSYEVQIMWPHHSSVRGRSDKITFFLIHPQSWSLYFPTNDDVSNGIMWGNLMD